MFIINKNGDKMPVDDSSVDYNKGYHPCVQLVTLIDDGMYLEDVWVANCYKDKNGFQSKSMELEFVAEKEFDHEPTHEELIHFMASNGLTIYDFVGVEKMLKLEQHCED